MVNSSSVFSSEREEEMLGSGNDIKDVICGNDHYYVAYVYRNDVKKLNYLGIDYIVEYIEELNREPYYTFPGEYAAIYEAVWLFDELNVIDNPFFDMVLSVQGI